MYRRGLAVSRSDASNVRKARSLNTIFHFVRDGPCRSFPPAGVIGLRQEVPTPSAQLDL
jgi:hypothetical protein